MTPIKPTGPLGPELKAAEAKALSRELGRVRPHPAPESAAKPEAQRLSFEKKALKAALGLQKEEASKPRDVPGGHLRGIKLDIFI